MTIFRSKFDFAEVVGCASAYKFLAALVLYFGLTARTTHHLSGGNT